MIRSKLLKVVTYNRPLALMSTNPDTSLKDKKLEHYKNLQHLQETSAKPPGWDDAKPFSAIPGPKPLPVVGNTWRFVVPKVGSFYQMDMVDVQRKLQKEYGDIAILDGILGGDPIVILFNPTDFEMMYRNEGIWPIRKNLPSLDIYRKSREHIFPNSGLLQHGEKWFQYRSTVNPILMQPRNIAQYAEKMDEVAGELINNVKYLSEQNANGEMPSDFTNELYKWALESVAVVTLDTRLGCLKKDLPKDSEPQRLINSAIQMFQLIYKLDFQPSLYKYVSTPNWKEFTACLDFMISTNINRINQALDQLEKDPIDPEDTSTKSVLQQLLKKDKKVAVSMAIDMLLAGVDTTGRVLGAALYYLSKNTDKQEELRKEAKSLLPSKDTIITKEILAKAKYLKACVKETTRLAPIGIGNMRETVKDLVLAGYQIPKGTDVMTANLIICSDDRYFSRAKEFLPERWLSTASEELSRKSTNPFIYAPFGYGPRSCIGKRLATLEIETAMLKMIRNFDLSWPHEDMVFATSTLYGIAKPLKIHVRPLDN